MNDRQLVSYSVIIAAKNGDSEAVYKILEHYDSLVNHYARRKLYDENGQSYSVINTDIKDFIQSKIISSIIYEYDPYSMPEGETLEQ